MNIIAERHLVATNGQGIESLLRICLGSPYKVSDKPDFFVQYSIEYNDEIRNGHAVGIDGFQALYLAMKMISVELEKLQRERSIVLFWEGRKVPTKKDELYGKWVLDENSKTILAQNLSPESTESVSDTSIYIFSDGKVEYYGHWEVFAKRCSWEP